MGSRDPLFNTYYATYGTRWAQTSRTIRLQQWQLLWTTQKHSTVCVTNHTSLPWPEKELVASYPPGCNLFKKPFNDDQGRQKMVSLQPVTGSAPQGSLIVSNRSLPFKYGYWQSWDGPRSTRYGRIAGSPTRSAGALIREWKWSRRGEARWVSRTIGSEYPKGRDRNQRKVQKGLNNLGTPNQLRKEEILWQRQKVGHLGFDKNTKTIS
jgi:hypothetical protein